MYYFCSGDIKQNDQNGQNEMKNLLLATTDANGKLDIELYYDNFFDKFKNEAINVNAPDDLINDYLDISEKIPTKSIKLIEIKPELNYKGFQIMGGQYLQRETSTQADKQIEKIHNEKDSKIIDSFLILSSENDLKTENNVKGPFLSTVKFDGKIMRKFERKTQKLESIDFDQSVRITQVVDILVSSNLPDKITEQKISLYKKKISKVSSTKRCIFLH